MKYSLIIASFLTICHISFGQGNFSPCSHEAILNKHLQTNSNAQEELLNTELYLQEIIEKNRTKTKKSDTSQYIIPVVMHVFHDGDFGKMDMEQALSGLEILNNDFNGLNDGWETIDAAFDTIKGMLDITFCLATIDPYGNSTTGLIYHEDADAVYNEGNLFQYAWDNHKYLNIYFPKYAFTPPTNFTAYAYYPSNYDANNNTGGIFYSSIRWGYGNHSELEAGDDWASVCSHEAGHWLNLRHTFEGSCADNDLVEDTPPTTGGEIELEGCYNNDNSCGVPTNGENFMDYNHRCKKMFTQGQVERMEAALYLPSRINLWSEENLIETGCMELITSTDETDLIENVTIFPNPAADFITIENNHSNYLLEIFTKDGKLVKSFSVNEKERQIDVRDLNNGIFFFRTSNDLQIKSGRFVVHR